MTIPRSLLLVEDDESLGSSLTERLSEEPYAVTWVQTVKDALFALQDKQFDLCLLDIGLPDGSGFNVAREIKVSGNTPLIFLTAMNSAEYRLEGFEIGCDDYIPKPFHLKELLLRIRRVIERGEQSDPSAGTPATFKLHPDSFSVELPDGKTAELAPSDFELLQLLMQQSPKVVERQKAFTTVFKSEGPATRTVDNSIVRIRTILGSNADGRLKSVRGIGYQWI